MDTLDAATFAGKVADLQRAPSDSDRTTKVLKPIIRGFVITPEQAVVFVRAYTSFSGRVDAARLLQKARPDSEFPGWFTAFLKECMTPKLFEFPKMKSPDREKLEREDRMEFCKQLGVAYLDVESSSLSEPKGPKINTHGSYQA
jgi:hypothetical protein